MGTPASIHLAWECLFPVQFYVAPQSTVDVVDEPSSVEDAGAPSPCPARRRTSFSHKASAIHRGSDAACGRRGKRGYIIARVNQVFQSSSNAQPQFGKLALPSSGFAAISSEGFPLFLPQLRGLLSCSLLLPLRSEEH